MAGKYGVTVALKVVAILADLGAVAKDVLVDKAPFAALTPAWDLLSIARSGVDLTELANEVKELDADDEAKLLAAVSQDVAQLGLPGIAALITEGAALVLEVEQEAERIIVVGTKVVAFGKKIGLGASPVAAPVVPVVG